VKRSIYSCKTCKDIIVAIEVGLKLPFTISNAGKPVMDANAVIGLKLPPTLIRFAKFKPVIAAIILGEKLLQHLITSTCYSSNCSHCLVKFPPTLVRLGMVIVEIDRIGVKLPPIVFNNDKFRVVAAFITLGAYVPTIVVNAGNDIVVIVGNVFGVKPVILTYL
jgi:hypothetical protein